MQAFQKFLYLLTSRERKRAILLIILILIMALLDMIGVASILPFMAVLSNPVVIETNFALNKLFQFSKVFGVDGNQQFIFALGIAVFFLLILSLLFKAFTTYMQVRFVQMLEYSISKQLVEGYLHQPYSWFLNRNSADLGKTILSEVGIVIGTGVRPLMELIAKGFVAFFIIFLLIIVDPKLALVVGFTLGAAYGIIFYFVRSFLNKIGKQRLKSNESRFTIVSEAFGAAKEVKVGGLEQSFIKRFSDPANIFAKTQASSQIISQLPRYFLEAISFGGILLVILYFIIKTGSFDNALPVITLYAFAGYRLMPALQQIYSSFTRLSFSGPTLDRLYYDLKNLKPKIINQDKSNLSLNQNIKLKNIYFKYLNSSSYALKNINLDINAKSTIGIVGTTGSGKTTTVDIILGLLESEKGSLEVDGQVIDKNNLRNWQRIIGYVPQHIYLSDDTVAANIAFGLDLEEIDHDAVEKVSRIANLHQFVINELPKQYQTKIGERGIRLSGGQRQRIGIARALYLNPKILILDEATSSLDNLTEKAVMDELINLNKDITIIMIAHRLSTVRKCDKIFLFEKGEMINQGTFDELIKVSDNFRIIAKN